LPSRILLGGFLIDFFLLFCYNGIINMKEYFGHNSNFGRSLDGLKLVSRCPVCQLEHNPLETSLLAEAGGSHLLYIKCRQCGSGVVAALTPTTFGLNSIGVVTDLTSQEIAKCKDWPRLSAEEVLELVEYFQTKFNI